MTRDSRIGLFVGLLFILAFGLILTELVSPEEQQVTPPPTSQDDGGILASYTHARSVQASRTPRVDRPPTATTSRETRREELDMLAAVGPDGSDPEMTHDPEPIHHDPGEETQSVRPQGDQRYAELTLEQAEEHFNVSGSSSRTPSAQRYVVRSGDTLSSIARRLMGNDRPETVRRLYEANRGWIADPNTVHVGMELVIP